MGRKNALNHIFLQFSITIINDQLKITIRSKNYYFLCFSNDLIAYRASCISKRGWKMAEKIFSTQFFLQYQLTEYFIMKTKNIFY